MDLICISLGKKKSIPHVYLLKNLKWLLLKILFLLKLYLIVLNDYLFSSYSLPQDIYFLLFHCLKHIDYSQQIHMNTDLSH